MTRGFGNQGYEDADFGAELDADYAERNMPRKTERTVSIEAMDRPTGHAVKLLHKSVEAVGRDEVAVEFFSRAGRTNGAK